MPTTGEIAVEVGEHSRRLNENDKDHARIYKSVDAIKNRPPVWASLLIAALVGVVSALLRGAFTG